MGNIILDKELRKKKKKMASPISFLSILIIPLLVTSLFYDVSNADRALVEKVCTQSSDYNYCLSVLLSDPEGLTNILYRLGLVSTSASLKIIPNIEDDIWNYLDTVTDTGMRERITGCQTDISGISEDFKQARIDAGTQSYVDEYNILVSAQNKIAGCNQRFVAPPTVASPITSSTSEIEKLINISMVIAKMLKQS